MLTRELYAGYITIPDWGLHLVPAKHEPLISYETFMRIEGRLKSSARVPARKDLNESFPLRGFVRCTCGTPLTACWSKGRSARHPYYLCHRKGCPEYGKSIRRDVLEGQFEALLNELRPSASLFKLANVLFRKFWNDHSDAAAQQIQSMNPSW
jgi:site-specific DNA recombinase